MNGKDSNIRAILLALAFSVGIITGCSQEGSGKKWDWFGLKKDNSEVEDASAPAREPPPRTRTAKAGGTDNSSRELTEDDARAARLNGEVDSYTRSVDRSDGQSYAGNDLNSKINRQNDPNRSTRIRQTAAKAKGGPGAEYDAGDTGRASATMERGNFPPTATASPARTQQIDLKPTSPPARGTTAAQAGRAEPAPQSEPAPSVSSPSRDDLAQGSARPKPGLYQGGDTMTPIGEPGDSTARTADAPPRSTNTGAGNVLYNPPPKPAASEPPIAKNAPEQGIMPAEEESLAEAPIPAAETKIAANPAPTEAPARPPVISEVKVAPADPPKPKAEAAAPERISTNSAPSAVITAADATAEKIAEQEKLVARDPNNLEEQFRLRLMYLVNGQDDRALAPTPGVNEEIQEIMQGHIHSVLTARSTSERDPATWANRQLDAIENLRSLVRSKADLRVPKLELCSAIDGFGRYEPITPAQFTVGAKNLVLLYIEVDNFRCEETSSGMYRTLLSVRQSLLDHTGQELWTKKDENIEDLARRRRTDFFLTIGPLAIPKTLGPGEYVMKVEVEDVLAGKMNGNSVKFKMVP